jgi:hypothetical protein
MKSFLWAVVVSVVIATVAGYALNSMQKDSEHAYTTTGVRL